MADSSSVNITTLGDVGITLIRDLMPHHQKGLEAAGGTIGTSRVGAVGTSEAHQFAAWYAGAVDALGQFLTDVTHGVQAHGNTAVVMADIYRHGDLSQAEAMNDVYRAVHPSAGEPSLASQDAAAKRSGKTSPNSGKKYLKSNGDTKPPKPEGPSPQQQVQQHQKRYGKEEHWHPVDPSPPIDPKKLPA
jgi:hypothetical protein